MVTKVREARPQIMIGGTDYYSSLAPYLLSFEYCDSCDGEKSDEISIELADPNGEFIGTSHPQKGAYFDASIMTISWDAFAPPVVLECGRFYIDSVSFSGPPGKLSIKANSVPTDTKVKNRNSTRAWEKTTLKDVADSVAGENQMTVRWDAEPSPQFKRLEQKEQTDLAFLRQRAKDVGLSIKVSKRQIIFWDEQTYEEKPPSFTLVSDVNKMQGLAVKHYNFSTHFTDTAKSAKCEYVNPETGALTSEEFVDSDPDNWAGQLIVNENPGYEWDEEFGEGGEEFAAVASVAQVMPRADGEFKYIGWDYKQDAPSKNKGKGAGGRKAAKRVAKKALRDKNKEKTKAGDKSKQWGIDLAIGNPSIAAGQTCEVKGFGFYDGKYFVVSARHKVGNGGYDTSLSIRKCLEGY